MTILQSGISQAASGGYQIERSLRFNSADSAYLSRTPSIAGNRRTWTWSSWIKRSTLGTSQYIFSNTDASGLNGFELLINSSDLLRADDYSTTNVWALNTTTQVFRDTSAFFHLVVAYDTTQATSSNRVKFYINGVQVTSFTSASYPTLNYQGYTNNTNLHAIGRAGSSASAYVNGLLSEIHFIDGQALTPSSFGETDTNTGVWNPKLVTGMTYGTNGFYLKFSDNSNTTAATLGKDSSGNGNNWTPNNFSVTAGSGNDSLVDTPTNYGTDTGIGGELRGNYATWNNLYGSGGTFTNGNLNFTAADNGLITPTTFFPTTGKWYCETVLSSGSSPRIGITNNNTRADLGGTTNSWAYLYDGRLYHNASVIGNTGVSPSFGDVVMMALDIDAGKLWFGVNGTWMSSGVPSTGTNPQFTFTANQALSFAVASGGGVISWTGNFGQRAFAYTAPSGFKALCTQNLPTPTIGASSTTLANKNFNTILYTGNGSTQSISGVNFQPDLVWVKNRTVNANHRLFDSVRGTTKVLFPSNTDAEVTDASGLTSFDADGFSVGANQVNDNTNSFVAWNWKAGSAVVTNTSGSISSQVSANPTAGISVVTYTGNGTSGATFGHGLGAVPKMIIFKCRNFTYQWLTYHASLANTTFMCLDSDEAPTTSRGDFLNSTTPSSSLITLGNTQGINESTRPYVAHCFAEVAGFSKFGSYVGNGSADGPFVYCGFRPRYLLIKRTDTSGNWWVIDTARSTFNVATQYVLADSNAVEASDNAIDILSNGFKLRVATYQPNTSGGTFSFAAFAESPFNYSRAR